MKSYTYIIFPVLITSLLLACNDRNPEASTNREYKIFTKSDIRIPDENLPEAILDYITINYSNAIIVKSKIENNTNYELELDNNLELIFDSKGSFLGIDDDKKNDFGDLNLAYKNQPQKIKNYIHKYYSGLKIKLFIKENNGRYEVLLDNGDTIIFDGNENFLGIGKELRYGGKNSIEIAENFVDNYSSYEINPALLPTKAMDYLVSNYDSYSITEVFLEEDGDYEVTFDSGAEIYFRSTGVFLNTGNANGSDTKDNAGGEIIQINELPGLVTDFVNMHYPDQKIVQSRKRIDDRIDVDLDNGIEIYFDPTGSYLTTDFNSNGDDHGTEIALESLPQHVQDSLFINYPSQSLFKVQLEASGHYKIFFKNQSQVYFDDNGNQIKINSLKK